MFIQAFFAAALLDLMWVDSVWWTVIGFLANGLFFARFAVQWWVSEKHQRVIIPVLFWYFSIAGGWLNLLYAAHLWKMPLLVGAVGSLIVSHRNLHLHQKGLLADVTVRTPP